MKYIVSLFPIIVFASLFQSCTGCGEDDYSGVRGGNSPSPEQRSYEPRIDHAYGGRIVVKMKKEDGVYKIPVRINGQEFEFIFDTGAGMISISNLEATLLYKQGKISKNDFVGNENFQDATGKISQGTIINLKEVSIGGKTIYNIHASVTDNAIAPLLLGQTVLEKFGKITIDYQNLELIFE